MRLHDPHLLWLMLALPPLLWAYLSRSGGRGGAFGIPTANAYLAHAGSGRAWLRRALPVLRVLALIALIVALARPQYPQKATRIYREGIAIAMVVDISSSMGALDLELNARARNRLDVVKQAFRAFVKGEHVHDPDAAITDPDAPERGESRDSGRAGDLLAMVTFARFADILAPLTADHDALLTLLERISLATLREEDGTAIGEGIVAGIEALRNADSASKVMIVLTDGSNNTGSAPPLVAAHAAKALGIRIYTIGAGAEGTAMMPARGRDGSVEMRPAMVYIDEFTLKKVAATTGGRYFRATDGQMLNGIYADIDRLEKARQVQQTQQRYAEAAPALLLLAFALLLAELIARYTIARAAPALEAP